MSTRAERTEAGTWTFYVVFVLSVFFEATLIKLLGFWLGGAVLLVGGLALGFFSLKFTNPETKAQDPFFRAAVWCVQRQPQLGYLVLAVVLGGAPGTAVVYKKLHHPQQVLLTVCAAVLFALVWAVVFSFV